MKSLLHILLSPTLALAFLLSLSGCDTKVFDKLDRSLSALELESQEACKRGQCPCQTPLGPIEHGSKVVIYSQAEASCDQGCGDFATELTCNNGDLMNGSQKAGIQGAFFKCTVSECPACQLGDNLIRNGETISAYNRTETGCRESCDDFVQQRTCEMGKLSGSDTFFSISCDRKVCRCELPDQSGYLSLDGKITLYSAEQATCGQTCNDIKQERTCSTVGSGANETYALDGSAGFRFRECREAVNCFCTLPNSLGILAHGATKTIHTQPTVGCGLSCDSVPSVTVKCDNGTFKNNANLSETINFESATYSAYKYTCRVEDCNACLVPGSSTFIPHGQSYAFAKTPTVACGSNCDLRDRTCINGTFDGDTSYASATCTQRTCTCDVPGMPGVSINIGSKWPFYSAAVPQCGKTCVQISADKTCTEVSDGAGGYNYVFTGSSDHAFSSCSPATGCQCALPNGLGSIEDKKTETLTSEAVVPCGKSCSEIPSINVVCGNGMLFRVDDNSVVNASDPANPYKYRCTQATCQACPLPGYGSIANNSGITLYSKSVLTCADDPALLTFQFKCENGKLLRNGNPYDPATDPNAPASWSTSFSIDCPGCNLPWGGFLAEGGTVNAYKFFGTVINGCGRGCKVSERKCTNGVLSGDPTYDMASCNNNCTTEGGGAPPRACLLRWQNSFVSPDSQIPIWSKNVVPCGDSCQNYFKLDRCNMINGTFPASFDFQYPACTETCAE